MILPLCAQNKVRKQRERKRYQKRGEKEKERYHHPWIQQWSLLWVVVLRWRVHAMWPFAIVSFIV